MSEVSSKEAEAARDVVRMSIRKIGMLGVDNGLEVDDDAEVLRDGRNLLVRCFDGEKAFMHEVPPCAMPR